MARKTKKQAEQTYHTLLDAASELFYNQGYTQTTLNEIARHAGMTRGAVYWHFSSKSDIVQAIWEHHAEPVFNPISLGLNELSEDNPAKDFRAAVSRLLSLIASDQRLARALFILMHNMETSVKDGQLLDFLKQAHAMVLDTLQQSFDAINRAGQLRDSLNTKHASLSFFCLLLGVVHQSLLPFRYLDVGTDGHIIMIDFLDGALKPSK
ncbi:transcriptional regulator, TetR family [Cohaesibacter sp. ES.047]|uniref:TetR family transcriptional regulator n=1 Tax=Cohaesibacter sp. ES.047 TaxID=1798205 RepID=UPI000BB93405|nr:TetR family transcriptional regulator [Cohaesibacter sp. ES.047]SNY93122.1 transcriptional regulator, TetR family [Cohaesibacter sp. ES.047]